MKFHIIVNGMYVRYYGVPKYYGVSHQRMSEFCAYDEWHCYLRPFHLFVKLYVNLWYNGVALHYLIWRSRFLNWVVMHLVPASSLFEDARLDRNVASYLKHNPNAKVYNLNEIIQGRSK